MDIKAYWLNVVYSQGMTLPMFRSRIDHAVNMAHAAAKTGRARAAEAVGSERNSWPALNQLDRLVVPYLSARPGGHSWRSGRTAGICRATLIIWSDGGVGLGF